MNGKKLTHRASLAFISLCVMGFFGSALADSVNLRGGVLLTNLLRTTNSNDASASIIGTPHLPLLGLSLRIGAFRPSVDYTLLGHSDEGDTYTSKYLIVSIPYDLNSGGIVFKIGPTAWINTLSGGGGNISLSNGTTTTNFSKPGRSVSTRTLGVLVGSNIPVSEDLSVNIDAHILAPLTTRRSYNLIAQLSWSLL